MTRKVLILCTGNSCRSQMAEGLWRELGRGEWEAFSAGSRPSGFVHPLAIKAMGETGIDLTSARSKSVDEFRGQIFDIVVTVCDHARESCPVFPDAGQDLHWPFDDPADVTGDELEKLRTFVRIRKEIEIRIQQFLREGN
jgi:arsenate reductase